MHFVRVGHDVWGRDTVEGVSWDLLPVALAVGALVIVVHAIYRLIRRRRTAAQG